MITQRTILRIFHRRIEKEKFNCSIMLVHPFGNRSRSPIGKFLSFIYNNTKIVLKGPSLYFFFFFWNLNRVIHLLRPSVQGTDREVGVDEDKRLYVYKNVMVEVPKETENIRSKNESYKKERENVLTIYG